MILTSVFFLFVYLPIVLIGYYLIRKELKNLYLLVMSILFYMYGQSDFVVTLLVFILVNYLIGRAVALFREKRVLLSRLALLAGILFDVGMLFVYKYMNFSIDTINHLFKSNIPLKELILPLGISFFVFKAISYIADVYLQKEKVEKNCIDFALYISFFPQLLAGPISRYGDIRTDLKNRREKLEDISQGISRFVIGMSKKLILCNAVAVIADKSFEIGESGGLSVVMAWLGAICYTLQIYYDFSGYSDMAIGIGNMLGFHFKENFDYPYISASVTEFWRRWHISLGSWFRDYIYFPLGGSRVKSKGRLFVNLMAVWLLTGIWHGANWTFLVWGLFYLALLVFEKFSGYPKKCKGYLSKTLYRIFTIVCVILGWVIFRASNLKHAFTMIKAMFGIGVEGFSDKLAVYLLRDSAVVLVLGVIFSIPLLRWINKKWKDTIFVQAASKLILLALFVICIMYCVNSSYNPFIYVNF